jgi:hypothetical protein
MKESETVARSKPEHIAIVLEGLKRWLPKKSKYRDLSYRRLSHTR